MRPKYFINLLEIKHLLKGCPVSIQHEFNLLYSMKMVLNKKHVFLQPCLMACSTKMLHRVKKFNSAQDTGGHGRTGSIWCSSEVALINGMKSSFGSVLKNITMAKYFNG